MKDHFWLQWMILEIYLFLYELLCQSPRKEKCHDFESSSASFCNRSLTKISQFWAQAVVAEKGFDWSAAARALEGTESICRPFRPFYKFHKTFPRSSENSQNYVKYLLFFVCVSDLIQRNLLVYIQVDPGDNFHPDLSPFLGCRSHKIHLSHHYPLQVVVLSEMVPGIENLCFLQRFLSL